VGTDGRAKKVTDPKWRRPGGAKLTLTLKIAEDTGVRIIRD
jgi:hypothetical protein